MKVFITGSSGRVGTHIIPHLVARGHTVTALVRSSKSSEIVGAFGPSVTPLIGDITDRDLLFSNAKSHDAVIHCAMDHSNMATAPQLDRDTVLLFGDALENTNKVFIMSSGTGFFGSAPAEEHELPPAESNLRAGTDVATVNFKDRGIRSIAFRLAMNTHNIELMHPFFGMLIGAADKLGYIPYIGDNHWSACHSSDAGLLYVLAMESAKPGTAVHAVQEFVKVKDIAEALGKRTGLRTGEVEKEKLGELGWLGLLLQWDQKVSTKWTKETFDWEPKGQSLLEELRTAPDEYFKAGHNFG